MDKYINVEILLKLNNLADLLLDGLDIVFLRDPVKNFLRVRKRNQREKTKKVLARRLIIYESREGDFFSLLCLEFATNSPKLNGLRK